MNGSIFPEFTLRRDQIHWEDYVEQLTPVHLVDGVAFKRDDYFAPLGYGGINGGKVRQLVWLLSRESNAGCRGVLYGCSVRSDVSARLALVALHYGLATHLVVGATKPHTVGRHENMAIALAAGAELRYVKVAYNPVLQAETRRLLTTPEYEGWYRLAFGVAPAEDAGDELLEAFYAATARQVDNLPSRRELILPLGSCNTAVSVLYGLARARPPKLERLTLMAIGPDRSKWLADRLATLAEFSGVDVPGYLKDLEVVHYDLHGTGWAKYEDLRHYHIGDLSFHPTYEGKMLTYLAEHGVELGSDTIFWVVGSQPSRVAMLDAFQLDGLSVDWAVPSPFTVIV